VADPKLMTLQELARSSKKVEAILDKHKKIFIRTKGGVVLEIKKVKE